MNVLNFHIKYESRAYGDVSTSTKTACASGLTTAGYRHGTDEATDCDCKLYVGNYILYAKTTNKL